MKIPQIKIISENSSINDVLFQDKNILITASNKFVSLWDLRTTSDVIKTQNKKFVFSFIKIYYLW